MKYFNQLDLLNDGQINLMKFGSESFDFDFNKIIPLPLDMNVMQQNHLEELLQLWGVNWHPDDINISECLVDFFCGGSAEKIFDKIVLDHGLTGSFMYINESLDDWGIKNYKDGQVIEHRKNILQDCCLVCNTAYPYSPVDRLKLNDPAFLKEIACSFAFIGDFCDPEQWELSNITPTTVDLIHKELGVYQFKLLADQAKVLVQHPNNTLKEIALKDNWYIDEQLHALLLDE